MNISPIYVLLAEQSIWEKAYNLITNAINSLGTTFAGIFDILLSFNFADTTAMGVFTAAGSTLASLFFALELFAYLTNFDFHAGIETVIKFAMKLVCYQMLISACPTICSAITDLFKRNVFGGDNFRVFDGLFTEAADPFDAGVFGMNYLGAVLPTLILFFVVFILYMLLTVKLVSIIFETAILQAMSPVALSTLFYSQSRSAGIAFIKNFAAVSMQWGVLLVCFKAFAALRPSIEGAFVPPAASDAPFINYIMRSLTPILLLVCLVTSVSKLCDLTKRALGG